MTGRHQLQLLPSGLRPGHLVRLRGPHFQKRFIARLNCFAQINRTIYVVFREISTCYSEVCLRRDLKSLCPAQRFSHNVRLPVPCGLAILTALFPRLEPTRPTSPRGQSPRRPWYTTSRDGVHKYMSDPDSKNENTTTKWGKCHTNSFVLEA